GIAAAVYGAIFTVSALRQKSEHQQQGGRAFSIKAAIAFALTLASILIASAALRDWFGETGVILATAVAGFVDTHAAAISVASLVPAGNLRALALMLRSVPGLWPNPASKIFFAAASGERPFASRVIPGLIVVALAAWAGAIHI